MESLLRQILTYLFLSWGISTLAQSSCLIKGCVTLQGKGLPNILVTNGFDFVQTNLEGCYELPTHKDARFVYLTTPSGYLPSTQGTLVEYYKMITEGDASYDFTLLKNPQDDNKHQFLVQADAQLAKAEDLQGYVEYLKDVRHFVDNNSNKKDRFMLDCGDIVGNSFEFYSPYIQASNELNLPIYRVIGNHDMEYGVRSYEHSYKTFEKTFGPIYYSFNRGKAHYIVLNNCFYINRNYRYIGYIDERTLQWIEKDLSYVPKDHLVFVAMHIPTSLTKTLEFNALLPDETSNASSLYDLLKEYDAHILSGHTHFNRTIVLGDKLMEHNTAAVCGTFWKSTICTDGTPTGFGVYEVDGNKVTWTYKSVGHPIDYQFRCYLPGTSKDYPEDILANVWNWDECWKVEWYEDGKCMGEMQQYQGYDPEAELICSDKEKMVYDWIKPMLTNHLFRATPRNKASSIEIVVTDRFGQMFKQELSLQK